MMYEYFYNGGGVAVGDLNEDGLDDIYFTSNMSDNKLYLNKGNMQFEDITNTAGVENRKLPWRTGVTIADINGDGKPDIFVSYSGSISRVNISGKASLLISATLLPIDDLDVCPSIDCNLSVNVPSRLFIYK